MSCFGIGCSPVLPFRSGEPPACWSSLPLAVLETLLLFLSAGLAMPVIIATIALAHSVFVMGSCTPPTPCPPKVCAHVVVFAPMLLSFSYLLGIKEFVALASQGSQGPCWCRLGLDGAVGNLNSQLALVGMRLILVPSGRAGSLLLSWLD